MRKQFLAATVMLVSLVCASGALAEPWSDPAGRLSFDRPIEWTATQPLGAAPTDAFTYVIAGDAANECHIMAQPNPGTANATADAVKRANADEARFTPEVWTQIATGVANIFPERTANVMARSTEGVQWPIQRAEIQSMYRLVRASMQIRPGTDILVFCMNYDGAARTDLFDHLIRSVGHPNDAVYFADAARAEAERNAQAAVQAEVDAIRRGLDEAEARRRRR